MLELTKFEVSKAPNGHLQIDMSNLDDSLFMSIVLPPERAKELASMIVYHADLEAIRLDYPIGGDFLKVEDFREVVDLLKGRHKIDAIRHLRSVYSMGLKEAKDLTDKIQADEKIELGY